MRDFQKKFKKWNVVKSLGVMLAWAVLFVPSQAFAYVIRGTMVDGGTNKPIRKVLIVGRNAENKVRVGIETDQNGQFASANVSDTTLSLEITKEGYAPVYMRVDGTMESFLDLGVVRLSPMSVSLDEVTVTAQSVTQTADRYIIIPSSRELEQSTNGLSLLNRIQFKLPGLMVNETLRSVSVDNKTPVFKINGKPTDINHVLSVSPDNVLRVEYHDNPDIRYGNCQIINFILKPRDDGGYVIANYLGAVTTGSINADVGVNYHYKKSEFEVNYSGGWRDYNKRSKSSEERFVKSEALGEDPIVRTSVGMPCDFNYLSNTLSLGYTYMHSVNTMFALNTDVSFESQKFDDNSWNTETIGKNVRKFNRFLHGDIDFTSPKLDLFFRKQINESQSLEVNAYGRYSTGDYGRFSSDVAENVAENQSWNNQTKNEAWRVGAEVMYSKSFSKHFVANFGVQDYFNSLKNTQAENASLNSDEISMNMVSAYTQLYGRHGKFNYGVNLAYQNNHSSNNGYIVNASRLKVNVSMNYAISSHLTANYLFLYDPSMPSASQQSELVQTIDGISVRQGNPDLKPSQYLRNRVYFRYVYRKFNTSLWVSHSRTNKPIYYDYSYVSDVESPYYGKFMSKTINGRHDDLVNLEWYVTFDNLLDHFTLWGKLGWDSYRVTLPERKFSKKRLYGSVNGAFWWGNWVVSANYQIKPRHNLVGGTFTSESRWNTIQVQYRYKNWNFALTGVNLFTKRGNTDEAQTISAVHPNKMVQCIKDNANMVMVRINYRLDFGKKWNKAKRTLRNDGVERGVDVNY